MNMLTGYYKNSGDMVESLSDADYITIKLLGGHAKEEDATIMISKGNLSEVIEFKWYLGKNGYPVTYGDTTRKFGRGLKLHHLLFPIIPKDHVVDHINRNRLDNRMENLRVCTQKQNSYNTSKINGKYKGVKKEKDGTYTVSISKDGNIHKINKIEDERQAAKLYDYMAEELFGEFAGKNFHN